MIFNQWGGMLLRDNEGCDNSPLFRAYFEALGGNTDIEFKWSSYFIEPGLSLREPNRPTDSQSWDNDLAFCYLSAHAADSIYNYGKKHWWYFNCNPKFIKFSWSLIRQPAQQYVICKASYHPAGFFRWLNFIVALLICSTHGYEKTSEILTQWLANQTIKRTNHSWLTKKAIEYFENKIAHRFGNWAAVFEIYFAPYPDHPIIKLAHGFFRSV
jgi:hypothetical protein